jgi:hypothetical protein
LRRLVSQFFSFFRTVVKHIIAFEAAGFSAKGLNAPEWAALAGITAFRLQANALFCEQATAANEWTGFLPGRRARRGWRPPSRHHA